MPLKSAYELAGERVISSGYKKPLDPNAPFSIDFVKDFEFPGEKPEEGEYSKAFIDREDSNSKKKSKPKFKPKLEETASVMIKNPETVHYDNKILEVHWNGHFMDYGGFSRMNRTMAFGLSNHNVKVKVEVEPYLNHVNKATIDQIKVLSKLDISDTAPKVWGVTVPMNLSHPGKKIVYTMIETSERVHHDYSGKLNLVDQIWVATKYGKQIMEKSSVYPPIYVMPLGVDTSRYNEDAGYMDLGSSMRDFRFLSVFRWSYRKGYDILLRAYLEEFSSSDNTSLLLVSRAVDCPEELGPKKILDEFNAIKASINKDEDEFPHVALYTKPIHERDMPKLYNSSDAFVLISRGEGFGLPYCFLKDTPIKTISGYKGIQDVAKGESVLTHNGRYKKVTEKHKNDVCCNFVNIKTKLGGQLDVTDNHAFKTIKKPDKKLYKNVGKNLSSYLSEKKPEWIRAKDLSVGDYLVYPIRQEWNKGFLSIIDVLDFVGSEKIVEHGDKIYNRFSNGVITNDDIAKMASVSSRQVGHFKQDGKVNSEASSRISEVLKNIPIEKQKSCIYRYIAVNNSFAKLLGYYCAEGNLLSKKSGIELHFHLNEVAYQEEVCDLIRECFGIEPTICFKKSKNVATINVCNSMMAVVFECLCGNHALNKKIPSLILESRQEVIWSFLNGYINGDGHSSASANIITITTASEEMAREYQSLMLDHGEVCTFQKDQRELYNCVISGEPKVDFIEIDLRTKRDNLRWNVWSDDKYVYIPITSLKTEKKQEVVYNIDVEEDHSYIAGIVVAHNCEAGATGLPIIASNCSGHSDFLNKDNSYLVEPQGYVEATTNGNMARMAKLCHFYEGQVFPDFGSEAIEQTKEHMRSVYENYEEAEKKASKFQSLVRNNYSWDLAVDRVYNQLRDIS